MTGELIDGEWIWFSSQGVGMPVRISGMSGPRVWVSETKQGRPVWHSPHFVRSIQIRNPEKFPTMFDVNSTVTSVDNPKVSSTLSLTSAYLAVSVAAMTNGHHDDGAP